MSIPSILIGAIGKSTSKNILFVSAKTKEYFVFVNLGSELSGGRGGGGSLIY